MVKRLGGRAAIITGSGDGIGRHIALAFAKEGASIVIVDIKGEETQETLRRVTEAGGSAVALHESIGTREGVQKTIALCLERFGRLDCIVNNAADQTQASLEAITDEMWNRVQAVNVTSAVWFAQEGLPYLKAQSGSSIVNISSVRAYTGFAEGLAYDTSKAALLGVTRTLAVELGAYGIRVNAICPGHIDSFGERGWVGKADARTKALLSAPYPLGRIGKPEEIAATAVFLASDDASFITGTQILVDGGMSAQCAEAAVWKVGDLFKEQDL